MYFVGVSGSGEEQDNTLEQYESSTFEPVYTKDSGPNARTTEWENETTEVPVRVEYDEGLIWVQATAAPTSARAVPLSDVGL
ncbi:hypothetical protein EEB12_29630 [Rhodococcus sp. WS1]|uniref:hypothetical protein n=1 Tax=unclassified Rhodococcus (in: high G+C Gram-positive bacteria) TaxID=192944 RepID=UPI0011447880|nr:MULTISPECIES: hypothetical protein [unclassified Rhodococcus (in: high G+C Gram-positive bacteria)]ROZ52974.1 hypothetical protein EEB12_29630 [Rhodococcus sp. WS1]TQC36066.1 hypothetical protein EEB16_21200 [Rhodococcus sp. WS7]